MIIGSKTFCATIRIDYYLSDFDSKIDTFMMPNGWNLSHISRPYSYDGFNSISRKLIIESKIKESRFYEKSFKSIEDMQKEVQNICNAIHD